MSDLSVSVNESLPNGLLNSIQFPFTKRFEGEGVAAIDGDTGHLEADNDGDAAPAAGPDDIEYEGEFSELLADAYLEGAAADRETGGGDPESEAFFGIMDSVGRSADGSALPREQLLKNLESNPGAQEQLAEIVRTRSGVSLQWIDVRIQERPGLELGNPIEARNLRISVRAKAEICVRIGKKICVRITSPWAHFENRKAEVFLAVEGMKVRARAKLHDLDFVIKVKILRKKFKIGIGLTKVANRHLERMQPVLVDLTNKSVAIPGLDKTYTLNAIEIPDDDDETRVGVSGRFS